MVTHLWGPKGREEVISTFFVMSLFGKEFFYTKPPVIWAIILFKKKKQVLNIKAGVVLWV